VYYLGKNGEPIPNEEISFVFNTEFCTKCIGSNEYPIRLKTNENGCIFLGNLSKVDTISAKTNKDVIRNIFI